MSDLRRVFARIDVRLALLLAVMATAFSSLLLAGFLAFATVESLEEEAVRLDDATRVLAAEPVGAAESTTLARGGFSFRVRDAAGHVLESGGTWPEAEHMHGRVSLAEALGADAADWLVRARPTPDGGVGEVALSLRHFVRERGELAGRALVVALLGLAGALAFGIVGARRALRPLRETTAAIRAIDPKRLDARIALRGTHDDIDALAGTTNEVLERLAWAFARLSAFSADAAHELRTPVNRLLNTAEVALTTTGDVAAKDDALESIRETAQALGRTIEQLLLLSAGDEGRLELSREPVELGGLVADLAGLYAPEAESRGRTIELAAAAVVLRADRGLLERAVANLLDNALKYGVGGPIRVGVESADGWAAIVVEDAGPGISAADRSRIFERFVRLDGGRATGGVGLGLSIARMVARLHGGELAVGSSALGGAAFRLALRRDVA
ncbi:MAG TPA: ATP-binding protein [Candidatus Binatia bacterium]|jgi:signal transduction histidine kinase